MRNYLLTALFFISLNTFSQDKNWAAGANLLLNTPTNQIFSTSLGVHLNGIYKFNTKLGIRTGFELNYYKISSEGLFRPSNSLDILDKFNLTGFTYNIPVEIIYYLSDEKNPDWYIIAGIPLINNSFSDKLSIDNIDFEGKADYEFINTSGINYNLGIGMKYDFDKNYKLIFEARYKNAKAGNVDLISAKSTENNVTVESLNVTIPNTHLVTFSVGILF